MRGMDVRLAGDFFFLGFAFAFMGFFAGFFTSFLVGFFAGLFAVFLGVVLMVAVAGRETEVLGKKERVWFREKRDDAKRGRVSERAVAVGRRREEEMRTARRRRERWENTDIVEEVKQPCFGLSYDGVDWSCLAAASLSPLSQPSWRPSRIRPRPRHHLPSHRRSSRYLTSNHSSLNPIKLSTLSRLCNTPSQRATNL